MTLVEALVKLPIRGQYIATVSRTLSKKFLDYLTNNEFISGKVNSAFTSQFQHCWQPPNVFLK